MGSADTETEVEVTITIIDVNDEPPTFNKREYRASVPENVPDGTPLPNLDMFVQDRDVVSVLASQYLCIFSVHIAIIIIIMIDTFLRTVKSYSENMLENEYEEKKINV